MRNRIVLCAQWRLAGRRMTHLYDSYLFESGWSSDGDGGGGGGRGGRLPRGNPSSANARASARDYKANVKQRSARLAGQSHGPLFFFLFSSITHGTNGREISLFCTAMSTASILFYFILSTVSGYAASRCNGSLCSEERKYLGGFFALLVTSVYGE